MGVLNRLLAKLPQNVIINSGVLVAIKVVPHGWGVGLVDEVLSTQACVLEFKPRHLYRCQADMGLIPTLWRKRRGMEEGLINGQAKVARTDKLQIQQQTLTHK